MKKTKLFSRIFAAALAATVTATTLITNSGAGLPAFAEGNEGGDGKYKVSIISPDVPSDGKSYTYNFYQILGGEVEVDGDVNVLGNPKWGAALAGIETEKCDIAGTYRYNYYQVDPFDYTIQMTKSEALFSILNEACKEAGNINITSGVGSGEEIPEANREAFVYGVLNQNNNITNKIKPDYFKTRYVALYGGTTNSFSGRFTGRGRDAEGLVECLGNDTIDGASLKAFADLLYNGVKGEVINTEGSWNAGNQIVNFPEITFLDKNKVAATQKVTSGGTFEVNNLDPGYYLVACVGEDNKLSNDGYETSMPVKPVTAMLILVGPANKGVAEIVGKNAYTVPTVTLDMYQKPVQLDYEIKTGTSTWGTSSGGGYDHSVVNIDDIIADDSTANWKNTGSFDYYTSTDRQEAILYRIGITLPQNFDQYAESGYFLAVLDQYSHFGNTNYNYREIDRVTNVRPYVYVKHSSDSSYELVGRCWGNATEKDYGASLSTAVGTAIIETTNNNIGTKLTGVTNKNTYNENTTLGSSAQDMFRFGNLYDYTVQSAEAEAAEDETAESESKCVFKPGDTIYIYYPAILTNQNVYQSENYLLNANRVWAVYSNNPYAKELNYTYGGNGCTHITNGDVGVTPIVEANVNTYGVTLKVDGNDGYTNGAKYALYREVTDSEGNKTREYAYMHVVISANASCVKWWIPESELQAELDEELEKEKPGFTKIEGALLNYSKNDSGKDFLAYLGNYYGINTSGMKIKGLAAGEYYIQELTISSNGISSGKENDNPKHENLTTHHYELAKEPFKFNIVNEYNNSVSGYLGENDNQKTFISKLTVDFLQDNPERTIETWIYKPLGDQVLEDKNGVKYTKDHVETTLNTAPTKYATEDGEIEIQVYHKKVNLIWLPETGGIGTMIFFIVGGALVVAATVLIVTRFRVKRERL